MRVPLIAGNFKMFKTVAETVSYINELHSLSNLMKRAVSMGLVERNPVRHMS